MFLLASKTFLSYKFDVLNKCICFRKQNGLAVCMKLNLQLLKSMRNLLLTLVTSKSRRRGFVNPSNFSLKISYTEVYELRQM